MPNNKQIPQNRWLEFFDQFSDGNKGRMVQLEVINEDIGDQKPIEKAPLWSLIYDPVNKGNDLTIEIGRDRVAYAHTIQAPTAVWEAQDENGVVVALEIRAEDGTQVVMRLY